MPDEVQTVLDFSKNHPHSTTDYPTHHLDSLARIRRFVQKADEIKRFLPQGHVLDWGCGYGQMSFLLKQRSLRVTSCESSKHYQKGSLLDVSQVDYLADSIHLPYADNTFDGVLSCGVLEHVEDPDKSMDEVRRVLKVGGYFFIYHLPNRYSWIEGLSKALLKQGHERLYRASQTQKWIQSKGFEVIQFRYEDFLPQNLGFLNKSLRSVTDWLVYGWLNDFFPRIPLLRSISQNLVLIAQRQV